MPKERPAWLKRALDPSTPMTQARETVRTASHEGKLYPTIRLIDGKLTKLSDDQAYNMAMDKGDYIQFKNDAQATAFSKMLSGMIGDKRSVMKRNSKD